MTTFTTDEIAAEMVKGFEASDTMIAATYSWAFAGQRATVNAAIRKLHREGVITPAYTSVAGSKVWKLAAITGEAQ